MFGVETSRKIRRDVNFCLAFLTDPQSEREPVRFESEWLLTQGSRTLRGGKKIMMSCTL